MTEVLTACVVICTLLNSCTEEFCTKHISVGPGVLDINCNPPEIVAPRATLLPKRLRRQTQPFLINFYDAKDEDLNYDTIQTHECSIGEFNERDADVLVKFGVTNLDMYSTHLVSLQPLVHLSDSLQTLSIVNSEFDDDVAASLPPLRNLSSLIISSNLLTQVPASIVDCEQLQYLDLSNNRITSVDATVLPTSLQTLLLNNNRISSVKFSNDLENLEILDLSTNALEDIAWLKSSTFPEQCQNINLRKNQITKFVYDNIIFLTRLVHLDVSYNNITYFGTLSALDYIKGRTLNLDKNPLYCNCSLITFGSSSMWKVQRLPRCAEPADLKGYSLSMLATEVCTAGGKDPITAEKLVGQIEKKSTLSTGVLVGIVGE